MFMRSQLWPLGYQMSLARQQKNHSVQLKKGQKGLTNCLPWAVHRPSRSQEWRPCEGKCGESGLANGQKVRSKEPQAWSYTRDRWTLIDRQHRVKERRGGSG